MAYKPRFIGIDFTGITEYEANLLKAHNAYDKFVAYYLNQIAAKIMAKAILRSPVATGTLRRSWKVGKVTTKGSITQIIVFNDAKQDGMGLSYASYVEEGHYSRNRVTWVEGYWMLTISTDELRSRMQYYWNIYFAEWVKRMGI